MLPLSRERMQMAAPRSYESLWDETPLWLKAVIVAVAYFLAAQLGNALSIQHSFSTFWPPAGVLFALLALTKPREWPLLLAAAAIANVTSDALFGRALLLSLALAAANGLEASFGAAFVRRFSGVPVVLGTRRQCVYFVLAAAAAPALGASVSTAVLMLARGVTSAGLTWATWWTGDALGILSVAGAGLALAELDRRRLRGITFFRRPARAVVFAVILALMGLGGWWATRGVGPLGGWKFVLFAPAVLAASVFGIVGATSSGLVLSVCTMAGLAARWGGSLHPAGESSTEALVLQAFLGVLIVVEIYVAAALREADTATAAERETAAEYRSLFDNAEVGMFRTRLDGSEIVDANEKFLEIFGRTRDEVIGQPSVMHWADPEERERMVRRLEETGRVTDYECRMLNKRGDVRTCVTSLRLFPGRRILEGSIADITERKQAEQALRASEDKFKYVFDHSPLGKSITRLNGEVQVNEAFCAMLGYAPEELLDGTTWRQLTHPDDIAESDRIIAALITGEMASARFDKRFLHKDGRVVWAEVHSSLRRDQSGEPEYLMSTLVDITEHRQRQEQNAERESRLRALLDNAPYGAHMYELDGDRLVFTGYNRRAVEMLDLDHEALLGLTLEEAFPGNVGTETPDAYRRVAREGGTWEIEQYAYDAEGIAGVFEVYAFSFGPNRVSVFFRDITDRKKLEIAVRESEERYSRLFESMLEGFAYCRMIYDDDGRPVDWEYLEVNSAFARMTGLEDAVGRRVLDVLPTVREETPELFEAYGRVASTGEPETFEIDFTPLGLWLKVTALGPEPGYFVAVFEDITDRKKTEEEIRRLNAELEDRIEQRTEELASANEVLVSVNAELRDANMRLEEATRAKSEFLAAMSHELRTPLNSIIGFSSVLSRGLPGQLNGEQLRQVEMINNSGRHLLELINDVLDLAKVESGRSAPTIGNADVGGIVRDAVETVRPLAEAKGLEVRVAIPERLPPIRTDGQLVGRVLLNLLGNAIKFTDDGFVGVTVTRSVTGLHVSVEDSGRGISNEEMERIFEDFYQVPSHASAEQQGTGLGLAVSQRLAQSIGASVEVASELGRGSVFTLRLPKTPA
jgi:PAS domain S-box-containing protein